MKIKFLIISLLYLTGSLIPAFSEKNQLFSFSRTDTFEVSLELNENKAVLDFYEDGKFQAEKPLSVDFNNCSYIKEKTIEGNAYFFCGGETFCFIIRSSSLMETECFRFVFSHKPDFSFFDFNTSGKGFNFLYTSEGVLFSETLISEEEVPLASEHFFSGKKILHKGTYGFDSYGMEIFSADDGCYALLSCGEQRKELKLSSSDKTVFFPVYKEEALYSVYEENGFLKVVKSSLENLTHVFCAELPYECRIERFFILDNEFYFILKTKENFYLYSGKEALKRINTESFSSYGFTSLNGKTVLYCIDRDEKLFPVFFDGNGSCSSGEKADITFLKEIFPYDGKLFFLDEHEKRIICFVLSGSGFVRKEIFSADVEIQNYLEKNENAFFEESDFFHEKKYNRLYLPCDDKLLIFDFNSFLVTEKNVSFIKKLPEENKKSFLFYTENGLKKLIVNME